MISLNQKGNVLLYAVIAMTAISVLGTGIYFMTTTSTFSGINANAQNQAYFLAKAGIDLALNPLMNMQDTTNKVFTLSDGGKFSLTISGNQIESTGIVRQGTPYEVKRRIVVTQQGFSSRPDVSFAKDISEFTKTIKATTPNPTDLIAPNPILPTQVLMGKDQPLAFGGISYGGTFSSICTNGTCNFGNGFMAYFNFKITKYGTDTPHGFVFTFFNGGNNIDTAIGGELSAGAGFDMPELLGYAGNSCKLRTNDSATCSSFLDGTGKGIQPPKVAVEFDSNYQACGTGPCVQLSRCDGATQRNHLDYVFWGDTTTCGANRDNSPTYDDNRHGAPTTGSSNIKPKNSVEPPADNDYFTGSPWPSSWLYDGSTYAVRIEVKRSTITGDQGSYEIGTWIKKCDNDISNPNCFSVITDFNNVKKSYTVTSPLDLPQLNRTVVLSQAYHTQFSTFSLGWRFAAGLTSRETVTLSNFGLYFIR
jgi:hypothetical protein